jgi:hypothetical protein
MGFKTRLKFIGILYKRGQVLKMAHSFASKRCSNIEAHGRYTSGHGLRNRKEKEAGTQHRTVLWDWIARTSPLAIQECQL